MAQPSQPVQAETGHSGFFGECPLLGDKPLFRVGVYHRSKRRLQASLCINLLSSSRAKKKPVCKLCVLSGLPFAYLRTVLATMQKDTISGGAVSSELGLELYSERAKRASGVLDVFHYDSLSSSCRHKLHYAIIDLLGSKSQFLDEYSDHNVTENYKEIVAHLRRVRGVKLLSQNIGLYRSEWDELDGYMISAPEVDHVLDAVEFATLFVIPGDEDFHQQVNKAFFFEAVGYRLEGNQIIRRDSEFLHAEAVKPAIRLLAGADWRGAADEFFKAHDNFRHGRKEDANVAALKSIESTMKIICDKKTWAYDPKSATFKVLVKVCFDNGLIPPFWESMANHLRGLLETSVPSARNKLGGHGQGAQIREVPDHVTAFILHMSASTIVFLREAFDASETKA